MIEDCAVYLDGVRGSEPLAMEDAFEASRDSSAFVWLDLYEPTLEEFEAVREEFTLHDLAVEDAIKAHQRPKVEAFGDSLFVVLKSAEYRPQTRSVVIGELQMFVGDRFLISVRHGGARIAGVREELERQPQVLRHGPSAALHAIIDSVVDGYSPVMIELDNEIQDVEAEVFSESRTNPAQRIYQLKRQILSLHEAVGLMPEELEKLTSEYSHVIPGQMRPYFRDVHDHVLRVVVEVESYRELLTSVLTANLTQLTVFQNEDMRKISAWAAMIAIPTLIAGIYGMNFEHMPELGWRFGYPIVLAVTVLACAGVYRYFKRIGWL